MSARPYGEYACPFCERFVALRKNGTMRQHQEFRSRPGVQFPPLCRGTGLTPDEAERIVEAGAR